MKKKLLTALTLASCTCACTVPIFGLSSCGRYETLDVRLYPVSVERSYIYHFPDWTEDGKLDPDSKDEAHLGGISIRNGGDMDHTCHTRVSTKREIPPGIRVEGGASSGISVYGDWQHFNAAVAREPIEIYMEYNTDGVPWLAPTHGWVEWPEPLIIPAYDGNGKYDEENTIFGRDWFGDQSITTKFNLDKYDAVCAGVHRIDIHPKGHTYNWYESYDNLVRSRIINIPSYQEFSDPDLREYKTEAIIENAFNLEVENNLYIGDDPWEEGAHDRWGRSVACEDFRKFFFGTEDHPETGFWKEICFKGYKTPLKKIGDHAFYHCWSLESSLATYYGLDEAHNMVYNGTHS